MRDRRQASVGLILGMTIFLTAAASAGPGSRGQDPWGPTSFNVDKAKLVSRGSNPHFILEPGYTLALANGNERLVITVLDETRIVDGVETRIVEERESKNGKLVEISRNFFAFNTADRSVYYFGEEVDIYKNGKIVDHEGAWESGKNGARFGLAMPGEAKLKARYYQEVAPGVAMDRAEIAGLHETLKTPAGTFKDCLKVVETTPLEPFARESKVYAPGIGLIKDASFHLVEYGFLKK